MRMSFGWCLHYVSVFIHTLIRMNAAPVECFNDIFFRSRNESVGVSVFDSDYEISSVLLSEQVIVKCRPDTAHMKRAGR